jgi:NAD-dependent SIR2 family protein deacetylase
LLGDLAIERGAKAILYPSTRLAKGINLVVFTQLLDGRPWRARYKQTSSLHGQLRAASTVIDRAGTSGTRAELE